METDQSAKSAWEAFLACDDDQLWVLYHRVYFTLHNTAVRQLRRSIPYREAQSFADELVIDTLLKVRDKKYASPR